MRCSHPSSNIDERYFFPLFYSIHFFAFSSPLYFKYKKFRGRKKDFLKKPPSFYFYPILSCSHFVALPQGDLPSGPADAADLCSGPPSPSPSPSASPAAIGPE